MMQTKIYVLNSAVSNVDIRDVIPRLRELLRPVLKKKKNAHVRYQINGNEIRFIWPSEINDGGIITVEKWSDFWTFVGDTRKRMALIKAQLGVTFTISFPDLDRETKTFSSNYVGIIIH